MKCCPFDLRDYFFEELSASDRRQVEAHLSACAACSEELTRLGVTKAAVLSVPDEEPPRRIAFVSDKVFEPSLWQRIWNSGAKAGFASTAMLSAAIFAHGYLTRPEGAAPAPIVAQLDATQVESEVARRLEVALAHRLAQMEQKHAAKLAQVVSEQKRMEFDHKADMVALGENFGLLRRQVGYMYRASSEEPGAGQ